MIKMDEWLVPKVPKTVFNCCIFDLMLWQNDVYFSLYYKAKCTSMILSHDFIALYENWPIYCQINKFCIKFRFNMIDVRY